MKNGDKIVIVERPEQYQGLPTCENFVTVYEIGALTQPYWRVKSTEEETRKFLSSLENVQRIIYT